MVEATSIGLTGLIAILATWMAAGLLARQDWRLENLASVGLTSPRSATIFGVAILIAVAALVAGWWNRPIGIAGIIVLKLGYTLMLVGYRRAGASRRRDAATMAMSAHSVATVAVLLSW